jgi:signal transduction histidine kinase
MRIDLNLFAAVAALAVGFVALWSNPKRAISRSFATLSLHAAIWLLLRRGAFSSSDSLYWLRIATAIGALFPVHLWLVKEAIVLRNGGFFNVLKKSVLHFFFGLGLGAISFTEWFIPANSTSENPLFGTGYYIYIAGLFLAYLSLSRETVLQIRTQTGLRRLELQIFLLGGCIAAGSIILMMAFRAVLGVQVQVQFQPLVVLVFYGLTVVGITTHRIFDARQILIVLCEKFLLTLATATCGYVIFWTAESLVLRPLSYFISVATTLWIASFLNNSLDRLFQLYPESGRARQAAFAAAAKEIQIDRLELAFLPILNGWGQSERALILSGDQNSMNGAGIQLDDESQIMQAIQGIRWVTPERLARERTTPERASLEQFLSNHGLGVLVFSEGPALKVVVGVGVPASRRPFTYPQVTQLMELSAIIENAYERAHLSAKAQHAEQLATVGLLGASLAHEIRNPLVSIKTFVQLLPDHYQDQVFRDKFFRLIGDEVTRIDRLTEQLLDLASPRVYTAKQLALHPVIQSGLELVLARAAGKNIELRQELKAATDLAYADPAAVKQVLLNLCFNAIQAVETQFGERWLLVATRQTHDGLEMAVSDSGPGIATAIMPRLFQPFQSTKSSGFGLGLAICRDILGNLNSVITVDQPVSGSGATFRVVFPCRPS